jgi:hypothetical protein
VSRALDAVVPEALTELLRAEPGAEGVAILVLTVRDDGWPHQAMVSAGELVLMDDRRLALALWPTSTSAANATANGQVTLAAVIGPTSYTVRARARRVDDLVTPLGGTLARFELTVVAAAADEAPYARLESGIRFSLNDPDSTLARWREVRAALEAGT